MNKNKLLRISLVGIILFVAAVAVSIYGLCTINNDFLCSRQHEDIYTSFMLPFLPLFFISLITYKVKESIFLSWYNFTKWWVPLSLLVIIISPRYSHDWMFPTDKGRVSFTASALFALISFILIAYKSYRLRGK